MPSNFGPETGGSISEGTPSRLSRLDKTTKIVGAAAALVVTFAVGCGVGKVSSGKSELEAGREQFPRICSTRVSSQDTIGHSLLSWAADHGVRTGEIDTFRAVARDLNQDNPYLLEEKRQKNGPVDVFTVRPPKATVIAVPCTDQQYSGKQKT